MLHPKDPELATEQEIRDWKRLMVELYKNEVSGLLVDPLYGLDLIDTEASCGWLLAMEKTGYRGGQEARETELTPGWSVAKLKASGAKGAKLLLYYDPENRELAKRQREVAKQVGEECLREGVIFLLEPLTYKRSTDPEVVLKMVDELKDLPVDIFKLEYPGDEARCRQVTSQLAVPWVLLSAGASYETYKEQLMTACRAGAKGMAAGRAPWQDFVLYQGEERERFLRETALARMRELVEIVSRA